MDTLRGLREIAGVAHADPDNVFEEGPDGGPQLRPWAGIIPAARKTIAPIRVTRRRLRGGGGKDDVTQWEVETVEVRFHPKMDALDKLCKHLGLTSNGAALEELLALLGREGDG